MQAVDLPTLPTPSARVAGRCRFGSAGYFQARRWVIPKMQPLHRGGWDGSVSGDRGQVPLVPEGVPGLGSWKVPSVMLDHHAPWSVQGMLQPFRSF